MLEAIAEGWSIALTDERVPEIVDRLTKEMTDPEAMTIVLKRLNKIERDALAFVAAKGQVRAHIMQRKYGRIRRLGPGRLEWQQAWRAPISATERLWFLGLIYRGYSIDGTYHGEIFFIPPDLLELLPHMTILLPTFRVESAPRPRIVRYAHDTLARDAFAILSYLRNNTVHAKKGILARRELSHLRPRLADPKDPHRLQFLHHLCQTTGLIHREQGLWKPTKEAASWLKGDALARRRVFYHAWLQDANWNELCMMPNIHCEATGWQNDPVLARKGIIAHLLKCPIDTWLTIASFVESIHEIDPDFMRPDGDYDSWYIRDTRTGQYLMGYNNWGKVEGALIRYLLGHPLLWLGIVAVGYSKDESPVYFKLTKTGAAILGLREAQESSPCHIIVRPNLQVTVPLEASWYDRFLLERFATWKNEQQGVAYYTITAESVQRCLESGVTIHQIDAFLRRATGNKVPKSVLHTLRSWGKENDSAH